MQKLIETTTSRLHQDFEIKTRKLFLLSNRFSILPLLELDAFNSSLLSLSLKIIFRMQIITMNLHLHQLLA